MSKTDRAKKRQQKRARYAKPSAPRVIGANDNIATANDNLPEIPDLSREPGVKETPGQRIFRQMLRRTLDERPAPARGYDPARLTAEQEKQLRRADERLRSDDPRKVASAKEEIAKIAEVVRERVEAHDRMLAAQQVRELETLRGGQVRDALKNEPPGRLTVITRDGLETLLTAKSITLIQHAAGLRYRADYELLDPEKGLTPPPIDQSRKIVRGGDGFAEKRAERELFVRDLESMIQEEDPSFRGALGRSDVERLGQSVWALREIAGKGSNLMSLSSSGSVRARTSEALLVALDCAAIAYGLE